MKIERSFKQMYAAILLMCCAMVLLTSCSSDDNDKDNEAKQNCETFDIFVRFLSPSGTNVLDSLEVAGTDTKYGVSYWSQKNIYTTIKSECYAEYTGKTQGISDMDWVHCVKNYKEFNNDKEETYLHIMWGDFCIWLPDRTQIRPYEYDETYDIKIKSDKLFGEGVEHTIKWYIHVNYVQYEVYKCEIDGVEYSLENDPLFNSEDNKEHRIYSLLTVQCK